MMSGEGACDDGGGGGGGGGGAGLSRSRVSAEQLELLLSFMEEHVEFASGKQSVYSRFSASKLWRLLTERLNAAALHSGGARKSPDKWCRYWADIKYKARKKCAAGGALGDLSSVEERLRTILDRSGVCGGGGGGGRRASSEEHKPPLMGGGGGSGAGGDEDGLSAGEQLATEELLAEAAMRSALAAEKQAEAVAQGVELLRELVGLVRERGLGAAVGAVGVGVGVANVGGVGVGAHDQMLHHHHRL